MTNKILIDSSHFEETRVAVLKNGKVDEYEFAVANKEELKGNIYLARVTKVESSLQAAFVDYGEKKQGFLPFNEININYFSLSSEEVESIKQKQLDYRKSIKEAMLNKLKLKKQGVADVEKSDAPKQEEDESLIAKKSDAVDNSVPDSTKGESIESIENSNSGEDELLDILDEEIFNEELLIKQLEEENLAYGTRFGYKIQDVIKPDQYVLVQIVKDERGSKGASLTTCLSLPGRYCVLMPNTPFEGGISKKISNYKDRKRLRDIIKTLNIPEDINIIIRTASVEQPDEHIIHDYNYVYTLWQMIKKQADAIKKPGLLYEEGMLIKRVIRDIYSQDIDEIVIDGKQSFETAKHLAKLIAPEIMQKLVRFNHPKLSLFKYYGIEDYIRSIYSPVVFLKSGGYIVIHPTEALVSIDINSGRSKGRRNVEETALKTNLEAAAEIVQQLKLRDIGGLIVIDFIDMENPKNKMMVTKKLKELVKEDRAKLQVGSISNFGLLEISRQRLRTSIVERNFQVCPKCQGVGHVLPMELNALQIVRNIQSDVENRTIRKIAPDSRLVIKIPTKEAFYILNHKRDVFIEMEEILGTQVKIECDDSIPYPFYLVVEEKKFTTVDDPQFFLEYEIEANLSKQNLANKEISNKKKELKSNRNNSNMNNKGKNSFKSKQVAPVKTGWLSKLFGK